MGQNVPGADSSLQVIQLLADQGVVSDLQHNLRYRCVEQADGRARIEAGTGRNMWNSLCRFWRDDQGQDIAEYAVMLAVILVLVVGTVRLVGSNANNAFSSAASSLQ